jgi:hypothetical protein
MCGQNHAPPASRPVPESCQLRLHGPVLATSSSTTDTKKASMDFLGSSTTRPPSPTVTTVTIACDQFFWRRPIFGIFCSKHFFANGHQDAHMISYGTFSYSHRSRVRWLMHAKYMHELCSLLMHIPTYYNVISCYNHVL